jgi:hypothetical protein
MNSTMQAVTKMVALLGVIGIQSKYPSLGPFLVNDQLGYKLA